MRNYDVIVVGAGPAGTTAAYYLAARGADVLLLEKEANPGLKPCGGGLSPVAQKALDFDIAPMLSGRVQRLRCTFATEDPVLSELAPDESFWMIRRHCFDAFLLQKAREAGVEVQTSCAVTGLERDRETWIIRTAQDTFRGRYVVAADGAKGSCARWLGFDKRKRTVVSAVEVESPVPPVDPGCVHLDFGFVGKGYLWNFPKADGQSLGAGAMQGQPRMDLREATARYAASFDLQGTASEMVVHPILLWDGDQRLHTEGAILAGEAACIVDPFTAEGIRPSLFTGLWAAEAMHDALKGRPDALEHYTRRVHQELGQEMVWAKRLARAFFAFPSLSYRLTVKHPNAHRAIAGLFCGKTRYADVAARALKRLTGL